MYSSVVSQIGGIMTTILTLSNRDYHLFYSSRSPNPVSLFSVEFVALLAIGGARKQR